MTGLVTDLRSGVRRLVRSRGLTLVALTSLAVGIGASVAITSVASAVLVRPLPYKAPEDLVMVWRVLSLPALTGFRDPREMVRHLWTPGRLLRRLEYGVPFADLGVIESWETGPSTTADLIDGTSVERLRGIRATASLFRVLGVEAALGRTFGDEETGVIVISDRLWRRRFAADPTVIGRVITLETGNERWREPLEVVGVMPPDFHFTYPDETEIWLPLTWSAIRGEIQFALKYRVVARLRPGVSVQEAEATLHASGPPRAPDDDSSVWLEPIQDYTVGHLRPALLLVSVLAVLVLVAGALNAATVFMAAAVSRLRDMRVCRALGASEGRLFRQAFAEVALVALVAGVLGLLTVVVALPAMRALLPSALPRVDEIRLDGLTLAGVCAAVIAATLLAGVLPAWLATRDSNTRSLEDGPTATTARVGLRLRMGLLAVQFALVTALLVAGGMVIRGFWNVVHVDKGFDVDEHVHVAELRIWNRRVLMPAYDTFERELVRQARELPYVEAASVASVIPLSGIDAVHTLTRPDGRKIPANERNVDAEYFDVMRIPLLAGRLFRDSDTSSAQPVVVVSKQLADALYPSENAVGRPLSTNVYARIVGVVADVRARSLVEQAMPAYYMPRANPRLTNIYLLLRTDAGAAQVATDIRAIVHRLAPEQPVRFTTVAAVFSEETADQRTAAVIAGAFALAMLLLSGLGLSGHLSHVVAERTRERAIRSALGASSRQQVRDLVRYIVPALAGGAAVAALAIYLAFPFAAPFLFQVERIDPLAWTVGALLVAVFSAAAIVIPARRMIRLDAAAALRAS